MDREQILLDVITEKDKEIEKLNKGLEYAKRIEKDYKTKFDKAIEYIKALDYENEETYDISELARNELLEILQGSDKE